jgi:diguanylate cyclase (GGDEF)-like protein/PAS domain S-box-containing protein
MLYTFVHLNILSVSFGLGGVFLIFLVLRLGRKINKINREQTELCSQETEARSHNLLKALPDMIFICDSQGTFLDFKNAENIPLFVPEKEFMGKKIEEVLPRKLADNVMECLIKAQKSKRIQTLEYQLTIESETRDYEARILAIEPTDQFLIIIRDISENKLNKQLLEESQSRLNSILTKLQDTIWSVDIETRKVIFINESVERIYGYTKELFLTESALWLEVVYAEDYEKIKAFKEAIFKGQEYQEVEYRIIRADGEIRWVRERCQCIYDNQGQPLRIDGITTDITAWKQAQLAIEESEERFGQIITTISDGLLVVDDCGKICFVNPAAEKLFNKTHQELIGEFLGIPFVDDESTEITIHHGKVQYVIVEMRCLCIFWEKQPAHLISMRNITEKYQAELALHKSEVKYRQIVETAAEGIWILDQDHKITFVNQQMACLLGQDINSLLGCKMTKWIIQPTFEPWNLKINQPQDFQLRGENGKIIWGMIAVSPFFDERYHYQGCLGMVTDITARKQAEEQLQFNATHDSLTRLPNRTFLLERLTKILSAYPSQRDKNFAVLFLDLDEFKVVNDGLGHLVGDELLKAIVQRLQSCLDDSITLARLGGDEFIVLVENMASQAVAIQLAEEIHRQLRQPFNLDNQPILINTSIGIAFSSSHYQNPQDILRDADTAMYQAKAAGKGCYAVFDQKMRALAINRLHLEIELRQAIAANQFFLQYQPIVCLKSNKILGFEALVRWQHPQRGYVPPNDFILMAEETGLIIPLGYWVLREACKQVKLWRVNPKLSHLQVSVNLSSKQLQDPNLIEKIQAIFEETGIHPTAIKLEITESLLIENIEVATQILQRLREQQIELCLDDFGTGYSSLSYLHRLPFNTVKIDRSFIMRMQPRDENSEIVRAIVTLAHTLGMTVIAEGVETEMQFAQLRWLSCEKGQGYFFAKPLSSRDAAVFLECSPHWSVS